MPGGPMRYRHRYLRTATAVLASSAATLAFGHHSYTRFDATKSLTLEGTIKDFQWTNPHVWIQLVVIDPATGKAVEWSIETDSPNMLARRGWTRKLLKPGDKAVVVVHPEKRQSDSNVAGLESLTVNGQRIDSTAISPTAGVR